METKTTLLNPMIIVIAVAVIFAIGVDIYVSLNIKKQTTPEPYYVNSHKVTYNTEKATTTVKVNPNDVTEAEYETKKNALSSDIVTDTSVTSGWKTYTAKANGKQYYTIKYPADWYAYGSWTLNVSRNHAPSDSIDKNPGSYYVTISPYLYNDNDATFTKYYGPGEPVQIGNYLAKYGTLTDNGLNSDNYLITVGGTEYLCTVFFNTPNDTLGKQMLSTLQIQ